MIAQVHDRLSGKMVVHRLRENDVHAAKPDPQHRHSA